MAGIGADHMRDADDVVLAVEDVVVDHGSSARRRRAVNGISLDLLRQESVGVVGESGCGKSSLAKAIMQLPPPTAGAVRLEGVDLTRQRGEALRSSRRRIQMIFQDPIASLNPRRRIRDIVAEGAAAWTARGERSGLRDRVDDLLRSVGLDADAVGDRRPREFSGGQCQRVAIARALMLQPDVLIADEPVSALDVSIQAQILNLLDDLKREFELAMIFISHDLAVIKNVSDRVVVVYAGRVCEVGDVASIFDRPAHPYTKLLLRSIPVMDTGRRHAPTGNGAAAPAAPSADVIQRGVELVRADETGCPFRTRCPRAVERCAVEVPEIRQVSRDHFVACHEADVDEPAGRGPA